MQQDNNYLQVISGTDIVKKKEYLPIPVQFTIDKPVSSVFTHWVSYIAPEHIQDIAFHGDSLWFATSGGIVKYFLDKELNSTWFGSEHNLPGSAFRCIAIDRAGYVWIGGYKTGLVWWDGKQWNNIVSGFNEKQDIYSLFVDPSGVLWCCSEDGLGTVEVVDGRAKWVLFQLKNLHLPFKEINAFVVDSKSNIYLGSDRGLFFKKADTENWNRLTIKDGIQDNKVTKLLSFEDNNLWIGTLCGVSILKDGQILPLIDIQECVNGLAYEAEYNAIWVSTFKNIYKCTEGNIFRFSPPFFTNGEIPTALTVAKEKVWVGFNKGAANFQPIPTKIQAPKGQNYPVGSIRSIFVEENHDVWVGSSIGLWRYKSGAWVKMKGRMELISELENVTHITADLSGRIWVSSEHSGQSEGLRMLKSGVEVPYKKNITPSTSDAMNIDIHGCLWVARNDRIYKFDKNQWSVWGVLPDQIELAQSIFIEKNDTIWLGSNTGLWRFQNKQWNQTILNQDVHSIIQNTDDSLLVGTATSIYLLKSGDAKEIKMDLPGDQILCLCRIKNGDLYIGTAEGLARYRDGSIEVWNIWNSGLAGQVVKTIVSDNNRLWVGTNLGLSQFTLGEN